MNGKINIKEKLNSFKEQWTPKIIAELNGQYAKLAKIQGEFVWHNHENEDEMFYIIKGNMTLRFKDHEVKLHEGDMYVIPKGVDHQPFAEDECHVLLIEPKTTKHTGKVKTNRTVETLDWI